MANKKGQIPPGLARWQAQHGKGRPQPQRINRFGERIPEGNLLTYRPPVKITRVLAPQEIVQRAQERGVPITYQQIAQIQQEQAAEQAKQVAAAQGKIYVPEVMKKVKTVLYGDPK
jgi:hypothetical protein